MAGLGVEGTVRWGLVGMWADHSDGFEVFVSRIKQTPKQNHTHFLTNYSLRKETDQETSVHSLPRTKAIITQRHR